MSVLEDVDQFCHFIRQKPVIPTKCNEVYSTMNQFSFCSVSIIGKTSTHLIIKGGKSNPSQTNDVLCNSVSTNKRCS